MKLDYETIIRYLRRMKPPDYAKFRENRSNEELLNITKKYKSSYQNNPMWIKRRDELLQKQRERENIV